MCGIDFSHILMRRLRESDIGKLEIFFVRNNRPEVTYFFTHFPLTEQTARAILKLIVKDSFFVLENADRFLAFSMLRDQAEGYDIPNFGIFVDWEYRNYGLGRQLSEWTFRWADQLGMPEIRLSVYEENKQAVSLYQRLGFHESHRKEDNNGRISLIMNRKRQKVSTNVFASTQALTSDEALTDRLNQWFDAGIHHIELSNCLIESEDTFLKEAALFPGKLLIHHFFPANPKNVILNLASIDPIRRQSTRLFFQRSLEWSAKIGAPLFSFHAGYITDPVGTDKHGFILEEPTTRSYDAAWDLFTAEVEILRKTASQYGVTLLIENNVVSKRNEKKLLLAKPEEFERFFNQPSINENIGILLDWGHWLVTAKTYHLDLDSFLPLSDRICGIHLHSNDGIEDEHHPLREDCSYIDILQSFKPAFVSLEGHYGSIGHLQHDILKMGKAFS